MPECPQVMSSRVAAGDLHSTAALQALYGIEGVPEGRYTDALLCLERNNITAELGGELETAAFRVLFENKLI